MKNKSYCDLATSVRHWPLRTWNAIYIEWYLCILGLFKIFIFPINTYIIYIHKGLKYTTLKNCILQVFHARNLTELMTK